MSKKTPGEFCPGEKAAQSRASSNPGPVGDEESLARVALHPKHFHEGKIDDSFIPTQDLKERGCSVIRKEICGEQGVRDHGNKLAKPPEAKYAGYAQIKAGEVRQIAGADGMRALCVWEQALPESAAHAIIKMARRNYARSEIRGIRKRLMKKMDMSRIAVTH